MATQKKQGETQPNRHTFGDGTAVTLKPIPPLVLVGAQSKHGRPEAPTRTLTMAGGGTAEMPRGDDEPVLSQEEIEKLKNPQRKREEAAYRAYRQALAEWELQSEFRMARILFLMGVEDGPPADQVQLMRAIGWSDPYDIKYAWLAAKLRTDAEIEAFFEAVTALTLPTEGGLAQAEDLFQGAMARESGAVAGSGPVETAQTGED